MYISKFGGVRLMVMLAIVTIVSAGCFQQKSANTNTNTATDITNSASIEETNEANDVIETDASMEEETMESRDHEVKDDSQAMKKDESMEDDVVMESNDETAADEVNDENMDDGTDTTPDEPVDLRAFNITGADFAFSAPEIRVRKGEQVMINFESTLGFHDWVVDEFNAATKQVKAGEKTSVTFTADKLGTFEYYCSVGQHRQFGMVGKLIVE